MALAYTLKGGCTDKRIHSQQRFTDAVLRFAFFLIPCD